MMEQIENRKNVSLCASLEALLFASGDGLTMDELTELLDVPSDIVEQTLKTLAARYKNDEDCGLLLTRKQSRYLLTTKLEVHEVLEKYYQNTPQVQLSRAAYETLAVIAYNEPCTRAHLQYVLPYVLVACTPLCTSTLADYRGLIAIDTHHWYLKSQR